MLLVYILLTFLAGLALLVAVPLAALRISVARANYNGQALRIQRMLKSLPALSGGTSATQS